MNTLAFPCIAADAGPASTPGFQRLGRDLAGGSPHQYPGCVEQRRKPGEAELVDFLLDRGVPVVPLVFLLMWLAGLLSVVILAGGVYIVWEWHQGELQS